MKHGRNDQIDLAAQCFLRRVAEDVLCLAAPLTNDAVPVRRDCSLGLLRHRPRSISLLPQPGGFEGFMPVRMNFQAHRLAVPHRPAGAWSGSAECADGSGPEH